MWVLVVCQANICRSRMAGALLAEPLSGFGARVSSAGLHAPPAPAACPEVVAQLGSWVAQAPSLRVVAGAGAPGGPAWEPPAADVLAEQLDRPPVQLNAAMVDAADLMLTASRDVSAGISTVSLPARARTLTIRRAAAGALYVAGFVGAGELPPGAPPLPPRDDLEGRWRWFVGELDASRGQAPLGDAPDPARPDDIPDPHQGGTTHDRAYGAIAVACRDLTEGVRTVLGHA